MEPNAQAVTLSLWVKLTQFTASGVFVSKAYRNDGTYTTPFTSLAIVQGASADGAWSVNITIGGTRTVLAISTQKMVLLEWMNIAMTWDGDSVRAYMNGVLCGTQSIAGANVDFGTHGPWTVAGTGVFASPAGIVGVVDDVRVESVVRSSAYLANMYKFGIGLFD